MARPSGLPPGYSYAVRDGKKDYNRVVTPTGENIPRRQARNVEAKQAGYTGIDAALKAKRESAASALGVSVAELKALRKTDEYKAHARQWKEAGLGNARRLDSEFNRRFTEFVKSRDNSPDGPRAKYLVKIGLRQPAWGWDVGETDELVDDGGGDDE